MERKCFLCEISTDYLKNHCTKHRLVCTHFDAFSMLIPNMGTKYISSEIFENFLDKKYTRLTHGESNKDVALIYIFAYGILSSL